MNVSHLLFVYRKEKEKQLGTISPNVIGRCFLDLEIMPKHGEAFLVLAVMQVGAQVCTMPDSVARLDGSFIWLPE
jgi:hypothetical protein